jgi:hypothetical protein
MCLFLGLQIYNHHIYFWNFFLSFIYSVYLMFLIVWFTLFLPLCVDKPCWWPQANISNKVLFIDWSQGGLHCIVEEGHRLVARGPALHRWRRSSTMPMSLVESLLKEMEEPWIYCRSRFLGTWIHKNVCSSTRWAVGSYLGTGSGTKITWLTTMWSPCIQIATWLSFICGTEMVIQWYHMTSIVSKFVCGHL